MPSGVQPFTRRENDAVFRSLKAVAGFYARAFHRTQVVRPCEIPATGPAILVSNHISSIDPVFLQAYCPRMVRWLMAKEYYQYKSMRWMFNALGVILVERGGQDLASTRAAMRALAAGYVIGVFPEGRIETSKKLLPFHSGIGLLALRTRAPVYPAYLDGTRRGREMVEAAITRSDAEVTYGAPIELTDLTNSRDGVRHATDRIQSAVLAMQNGSKV